MKGPWSIFQWVSKWPHHYFPSISIIFCTTCLWTLKENSAQKVQQWTDFLLSDHFYSLFTCIMHAAVSLPTRNSHKKLRRSFDRTRGLCDPGLTTPDHTTILPQAQAKVLCIWLTRLCYDVLILPLFSMSTEVLLSDRGSGWEWRAVCI